MVLSSKPLRRETVANETVSEPLPALGLRMDYAINPRWQVLFDLETFYIELGDKLRGSMDDLQTALEYRPFRHVSFGIAGNRLAVDAKIEEDDFRGSVTDLYRGARLYAGMVF